MAKGTLTLSRQYYDNLLPEMCEQINDFLGRGTIVDRKEDKKVITIIVDHPDIPDEYDNCQFILTFANVLDKDGNRRPMLSGLETMGSEKQKFRRVRAYL